MLVILVREKELCRNLRVNDLGETSQYQRVKTACKRYQEDKKTYRATHEVWVVFAEDKLPGCLVNTVIRTQVSEEWSTEKTWNIGIVHSVY